VFEDCWIDAFDRQMPCQQRESNRCSKFTISVPTEMLVTSRLINVSIAMSGGYYYV